MGTQAENINQAVEVNFDGLVGPNHNYAGLSHGNIASQQHRQATSNPKKAALQGLQKMKALKDMGLLQGILVPHERPNIKLLKQLGYRGSDWQILQKVWAENPLLAANIFSASAMWTANAATISPWTDTDNGRTHITPANLSCMFHRAFESDFTGKLLKTIFADQQYFTHHPALPAGRYFGDEGAANHTRFCAEHGSSGVEFFVYGGYALDTSKPGPKNYPARQSYEASQAIARTHGLQASQLVLAQQNPAVIDQGVFHNDVIAVGSSNMLFYHQQAFLNSTSVITEITEKMQRLSPNTPMHMHEVKTADIDVATAVQTYLFNTQLIHQKASAGGADSADSFILIAPSECQDNQQVAQYLQTMQEDSNCPVNQIHYFDLRESMRNGGGPACLRLRVAMNEAQINSIEPRVLLTDDLYQELVDWVNKHYRDQLHIDDLRDPSIIDEFRVALDQLSQILQLGNIYDFQL